MDKWGIGEAYLLLGMLVQFGGIVFGMGVLWTRVSGLRDDVREIKADVKSVLIGCPRARGENCD